MAYRDCTLGNLVKSKPKKARERIMKAYRRVNGNTTRAAAHLGVARSTLKRWVSSLNLRTEIEAVRTGEAA